MTNKKAIKLLLVIYGILGGILIYLHIVQDGYDDAGYMPSRISRLQYMLDLLNSSKEMELPPGDHNASYFFYLAILGNILHIESPEALLFYAQAFMCVVCAVFYPIIFFYVFENKIWMALLAPLVFLQSLKVPLATVTDTYWGMPWAIAIAVPIMLVMLKRKWDKVSLCLYSILLLIIGIGNVPRMHSSLPVLCILLMIVWMKYKRKVNDRYVSYLLKKCSLMFLCFGAYYLFITLIPGIYMKITGTEGLINNIPPWHTIYLSYGFEENPYGIVWLDTYAMETVNKIVPGTPYLSPEYFTILRNECIRMWTENPVYFIFSYLRKINICIHEMVKQQKWIWVFVCLLCFFFLLKKLLGMETNVRSRIREIAVCFIVLGIEFLFPLIAMPQWKYMFGLYGAWGLVFALIVCYCVEDSGLLIAYLYQAAGKDRVNVGEKSYEYALSRIGKRTECIICRGGLKEYKINGLVQCSSCGFITTDLLLSMEELKKIYSYKYYNGDEYANYILDKKILQKNFKKRIKRIRRFLTCPEKKDLFEIGCAYGLFLEMAAKEFHSAAGIDISVDAINYATEKLHMNAVAGDYAQYSDKQKYDVICMWDTIEHLDRPDIYVRKAYEALKPNGLLCITTGDMESLNAKIRGRKWRQIHPPTHLHYFSFATLKRLLNVNGFEVIDVSYPTNILSGNNILYTLLCLKSSHPQIYDFFKGTWVADINIAVNLRDFMFVIAQKGES